VTQVKKVGHGPLPSKLIIIPRNRPKKQVGVDLQKTGEFGKEGEG